MDFVRGLGVHTDKTFENLETKDIYEYMGLEYCVGTAALTFNVWFYDLSGICANFLLGF